VNEKKIVVIGAGPAGMMAALRAADFAQQVTLIEKNPSSGKKLLLSGKGRCNLTNACEIDSFIQRFSSGGEFLRDAFKKFFNQELMEFFETRGLRLKVERQMRVFPVTDRSDSIVDLLNKELKKRGVAVVCATKAVEIMVIDKAVAAVMTDQGKTIVADRVVLATGGVSYGLTGSSGDGIRFAANTGHRIIPPRPGLVPLEVAESYPRALEGLTLKNISLRFSCAKQELISEVGELMFTGFGISGPLVLTLSGKIADWLLTKNKVYVAVDLKPALSFEQLEARLFREFKENAKKGIKNALKTLLPQRMIGVFLGILKIDPDKKANQITQPERKAILSLFKEFRMEVSRALPIEVAMITRGGVSLKDINPRTMESRRVAGLYFAGEIIDVDADTGGFNLQAAFSTGYLAGESAARP